MEDFKKNQERDKDIVFSKSVKAGKRIYYVDVKKNRKGELFIALTEKQKSHIGRYGISIHKF